MSFSVVVVLSNNHIAYAQVVKNGQQTWKIALDVWAPGGEEKNKWDIDLKLCMEPDEPSPHEHGDLECMTWGSSECIPRGFGVFFGGFFWGGFLGFFSVHRQKHKIFVQ